MNRAFQNGFGKRTIKMKIPINLIDAFTLGNNEAFTGNQAAVCVLEREVSLVFKAFYFHYFCFYQKCRNSIYLNHLEPNKR